MQLDNHVCGHRVAGQRCALQDSSERPEAPGDRAATSAV